MQGGLLDTPTGLEVEDLRKGLQQQGYQVGEFSTVCTRHGDVTARSRRIVLGFRSRSQRPLGKLEGPAPVRRARGV